MCVTYSNCDSKCNGPLVAIVFRVCKTLKLGLSEGVSHCLERRHSHEEPNIEAGQEGAENPTALPELLVVSQSHYFVKCNILKNNNFFFL